MKNCILLVFIFIVNFTYSQNEKLSPVKDYGKIIISNPSDLFIDSMITFVGIDIDQQKTTEEFLILLNDYRVSRGLSPVTMDSKLSIASEIQAKYQSDNQIVTHNNPTNGFETQIDRMRYVGIILENGISREICNGIKKENAFCRNRTIAQESLDKWAHSPPHNDAMLWVDAKIVGVSFSQSTKNKGEVYVTVLFL
jgi:uncharacterized protein YkwD